MATSKSCTAIKACALLATLFAGQAAIAAPVGVVTDSTGPLLGKTASGSIKVLVVGSPVELSETLISRPGAYVSVTLTDHSALALGPDTELTIERYAFHEMVTPTDKATPADGATLNGNGSRTDEAVLALAKGRVRVTSGILGTRATDSVVLKAGSATIDIRHSTFIAEYIQAAQGELAKSDATPRVPPRSLPMSAGRGQRAYSYGKIVSFDTPSNRALELSDSPPLHLSQNTVTPNAAGLNPGLYVQVLDGAINVSNGGGTQNFTAGQFGFTPSFQQPPVILPTNPGMQFTPPPSFSSTTGSQGSTSGSKPGDVDCQVR